MPNRQPDSAAGTQTSSEACVTSMNSDYLRRRNDREKHVEDLMLFTDGSVNARSNIGYGAYLAVSECRITLDLLRARVKVRRFEDTSSTKLEMQTVLWALMEIQPFEGKVIVYTDSQNIMGLPSRRDRLEQSDYHSKKNRRLNNYELYQEFYRMTDQLNCEFVKVRGHQVSNQKDDVDKIFTLVDRASRDALRGEAGGSNKL